MWLFFLFCVPWVFGYNVSSSGRAPLAKLNDGYEMPRFGLGTWLGILNPALIRDVRKAAEEVIDVGYRHIDTADSYNTEEEVGLAIKNKIKERVVKREDVSVATKAAVGDVQKAVEEAIDVGYRHIDTAHSYSTEEEVGLAIKNKIKERVVKREDVFVVTKLWNDVHPRDAVIPALKVSLNKLGLDYVDLYLIHWPFATNKNGSFEETDYLEAWQGLIDAQKQGLTKSIGLSNFNIKQVQRLIEKSGVTPAVLQVEINLNLQQPSLLEFCKINNIAVVGYTPFGSIFPQNAKTSAPPPRVDDEKLVDIANKYNKTVPQVVLRYLFELGVTPIPKSLSKERVDQNIDIFDFELTQEERDLFKSYDKNFRVIDIAFWKKFPNYPF